MLKPLGLGAIMAVVMLWMMHDAIMSGEGTLSAGLVGFVLAHVAVVAGILSLGLFSPRLRRAVLRHRPSLSHVAGMVAGMGASALGIHLALHGGLV